MEYNVQHLIQFRKLISYSRAVCAKSKLMMCYDFFLILFKLSLKIIFKLKMKHPP
jgi:hypothetical protein